LYKHANYDQTNNVNYDTLDQINNVQEYNNYTDLNTSLQHLTLDHNLPNLENTDEELGMGMGNLSGNARIVEQPYYKYFLLAIPVKDQGLAYRNLPKTY